MILAQEPPASNKEPAIKVQVNQVLVPVVVTDRKGHYVTDLKAGDFQVFEDGVEQKLVALSTENNGASAPLPAETGPVRAIGESVILLLPAGAAAVSHTYLIVVDTLYTSFGDFVQVREALKKLFKEEEGSDSQYGLIALGRPTLVIQNLTRDPNAILTAVGSNDLSRAIMSSEHSNLTQQESELIDILEHCPPPSPGQSCNEAVDFANRAARERDTISRNLIADLRSLTEQLARMPGRRALILASDGFNLQPGRELFELISAYDNSPGVLLKNQTSYLLDQMRLIVRLATARNVMFYTLDSRGVYTIPAGGFDASQHVSMDPKTAVTVLPAIQSAKEKSAWENQDAMSYLAGSTGGVFYHGNNDLLRGFRQALADGRQHYVLAYNSSNQAADGKYRDIKVQVRVKNLMVRAKPGYWAPMASTTAAGAYREPSTVAALAPAGNTPPLISTPAARPFTPIAPVPAEPTSWATLTPPKPSIPIATTALSYVDMPVGKLVRELPELKKLRPADSQELLPAILQKVGANVAILFDRFPNVTSREQVTEERLDRSGNVESQIYQTFRYLAMVGPRNKDARFEEYRTDAKGKLLDQKGLDQYLITKGFVSIPILFHPLYQPDSRYRYLGQEVIGTLDTEVVAFAQQPGARMRELFAIGGKSGDMLAQGVAWIDPANDQIVRMRVDLRTQVIEIGLRSQTTRINFTEVRFKGGSAALWLPRNVEVQTAFSGVTFRNRHVYSEFKEFSVQTQEQQESTAAQR